MKGVLVQDTSAGSQEKAICEGVLISGCSHALLNMIRAELHLQLNQHTAHFSGSGRYVPAIFVIIVEQNETHLLWMTYTVQMKTHEPDETYFTFFAAGNEAGVVMQPLLKRHMWHLPLNMWKSLFHMSYEGFNTWTLNNLACDLDIFKKWLAFSTHERKG